MQPLARVDVLHLFPEERAALLDLLRHLHADEWGLPTVCDGWSVKDVVSHIIADDLGRLSRGRDAHTASWIDAPSWESLVVAINLQNEIWVEATRRLSPRILIDLLDLSGQQSQAFFETLDLDATGDPVSWAGPDPAPVWLDLAREYTERWAHHQQIRDAVGRPGLKDQRLFAPVIDCFMRALPHTFRDVLAPQGTHLRVRISGAAGGAWSLLRVNGGWALANDPGTDPDAAVSLDQEEAWRLFTKQITPQAARAWAVFEGDAALASHVLDAVAVIA